MLVKREELQVHITIYFKEDSRFPCYCAGVLVYNGKLKIGICYYPDCVDAEIKLSRLMTKLINDCAPSEDLDKPAHSHSLIRLCCVLNG